MPGRSDDHPALFLSAIVICTIIFSAFIVLIPCLTQLVRLAHTSSLPFSFV